MIQIAQWTLAAAVDRGGMGDVWRGVETDTGDQVGVKLLRGRIAREPAARALFQDEARAVAALDHPAVVAILDCGEVLEDEARRSNGYFEAGTPYLVMEWASGGSLRARRIDDWPALLALLRTVLDALAHAHARGVIHRDLKPGNLLWCTPADGRAGWRLADFGIARIGDVLGTVAMSLGTPRYMAPEQVAGRERDQGPSTDLYALGCLAWELATGAPVFPGNSAAILDAHRLLPPPRFRARMAAPAGLEAWLRTLLEKSPSARYALAADAADALAELDGELEPVGTWLGWVDADPSTSQTFDGFSIPSESGPAVFGVRPRRPLPVVPSDWRHAADSGEDAPAQRLPPRVRPGRPGLFALRSPRLVGRLDERDRLWAALRRVADARRPEVVVLHGPAGCGKSRLAAWLCHQAHEVGAAVWSRATWTADGTGGGIADLLTRRYGCQGLPRQAVVARLTALLRPAVSDDEVLAIAQWITPVATDADVAWAEVPATLAADSGGRPGIVWLDDLHWGGEGVRLASTALALGELGALPLLFVATVRDEEVRPPFDAQLEALLARTGASAVPVGALTDAELAAVAGDLLPLAPDILTRVVHHAAGNPQIAVHVVGEWVAAGALVPNPDGWRVEGAVVLPASVRDAWAQRLAPVLAARSEAELFALELAATLGVSIREKEWSAACDAAGVPVAHAAVRALAAERLASAQPGGWDFAHGMVRAVLQDRARAAGRLVRWHGACALAIEGVEGAEERLGRHLLAAGAHAEALAPLLKAATTRERRCEYPAAEAIYHDIEGAIDALALPHADPRYGAWAIGRLRTLSRQERLGAQRDFAERILAEDRGHDDEARAHALRAMGRWERQQGRPAAAEAICLEIEAQAAAHGWSLAEGVMRDRALCCIDSGRTAEGIALLRQNLAGTLSTANRAHALLRLGGALRGSAVRSERLEASACFRAAVAGFDEVGDDSGAADALNGLGDLARVDGELDAAAGHYRATLLRHARTDSEARARVTDLNLALVLLARGEYAEGDAILARAGSFLLRRNRVALASAVTVSRLAAAAGLGDWRAWDAHLARLSERPPPLDPDTAEVAELAARLCVEAGDRGRAWRAMEIARRTWEGLRRGEDVARCQALIDALSGS